ncbi:hypothetical protein QLL95_gp1276 [Cotonvirus japonicus]|uniref:Uncharacterized protein n=1 Tax=Cotonvirus japonicus TaxID=2811091 RepID=A0ABM7NRX8_9VIRU|nr:hypothetical protein QLL95_gp1276 [Cotonvirus japonicus]BCS82847.1 hypothetical protein [Cotonvirus japonicus]
MGIIFSLNSVTNKVTSQEKIDVNTDLSTETDMLSDFDNTMIDDHLFNNSMFYFKQNSNIVLSTQCQICKCQRFTKHQVFILSDKNLTQEIFDSQFDFRFATSFVCGNSNCRTTYSRTIGDPNYYDFNIIWAIYYHGSVSSNESNKFM